uniref:SKP1 component dimerisation domain-containing protein n=1 Tax=Globodera rostochiensis TaxID=31243 RepID=A0A914I4M9_GLORO
MSSLKQKQHPVPQFLLSGGDLVPIPDSIFIYSAFLRDYKKAMMRDKEDVENLTIPMPMVSGKQPFTKQHLTIMTQFFDLYTRHNYGAGSSSAKKVPSSIDLRDKSAASGGHSKALSNAAKGGKFGRDVVESVSSETNIAEMEAKSDAKTPGLPDWAHGFFSALDKNLLIETANVANFLSATQFVEHLANFIALKCREMETSVEIMEFLNLDTEDLEGEELRKTLFNF